MHAPATLDYFCALPGRSFWEWEADGNGSAACLHWPADGRLIAFRPELENSLEALLLQGFPPLGTLLLVLDTLRPEWSAEDCYERLAAAMGSISGEKEILPRSKALIEDLARRLAILRRLPAELTASGPGRQRLLRTLFEGCAGSSDPTESRVVLAQFVQTPSVTIFAQRGPGLNGVARLLNDLHSLAQAFERSPPECLEARLLTGLDEPRIAAIKLPVAKPGGPADLIGALETEGGELAQVAGLARKLNAILHVPKAIVQPHGLPVGGVTDITTRGDPSQLLVTELAWDDLTFAARLSQGEALYLRREAPPAEPPQQRILLLDTGIFLWGKPRLFVLGAALALLGRRQSATGRVYALEAEGFKVTALDSVDLVRTHLTRLQPFPNAGHALTALMEADDSPLDRDGEIIFISHPSAQESLNHQPVWRQLCETAAVHTLLVDRHGNIEFSRHHATGARLLSRVHVEADDLLESQPGPPMRKTIPALTDEAALLPRFYRDHNWPLFHPMPPEPSMTFRLDERRFVGVSISGCVCLWTVPAELGKILLPKMPAPKLITASLASTDRDKLILVFLESLSMPLEIVTVSMKTREVLCLHSVEFDRHTDLAIPSWQSDALVVHLNNRSDAYTGTHRGEKIASIPRESGQPWPVFDGERFYTTAKRELDWSFLDRVDQLPTRHSQRQFIRRIHSVAFGTTGVLMIMNEGGHTYRLHIHASGLSWEGRRLPGDIFHKLHPVTDPNWQELELTMAALPDGRRIVYDPRGFLHVCSSDENTEELSIILVRGHTGAWSSRARYYGEPNLLDGSSLSPMIELVSLSQKLFHASEAPPRNS